jgi:hypothetical protein
MTRVLHLTSPNMEGADIEKVQNFLAAAKEVPVGVLPDGVYGKATGSAAMAWKYRMGFPRDAVNTGMGITAQAIMFRGDKPLPPTYAARRLTRRRLGWKVGWGVPRVNPNLGELALDWGDQFVGMTESPAGSNKIPALVKAGLDSGVPNWIAQMGYPFCAYYYFLCSLSSGGQAAKAALVSRKYNGLFTPAIYAEALNSRNSLMVVGASQAQPGDGALFDFGGGNGDAVDHIGRVRKIEGGLVTLEGNTSFGPGGSQSNGGAIAMRTDRDIRLIKMFFRELA